MTYLRMLDALIQGMERSGTFTLIHGENYKNSSEISPQGLGRSFDISQELQNLEMYAGSSDDAGSQETEEDFWKRVKGVLKSNEKEPPTISNHKSNLQ